ncbi:2-oxoglutarate (2OG) and Fe(II)-dependent oxygenase superfamily protein [Striga asiatica]|uniref:2-oxoglutarate (2OG) and Fe(II)-dependent oxygenase superfamily protein n=1 Tax=Striga asiatica TaxID=4170 RepID=A0A5A7R2N6_STRAF|nr:2-oxoglutarate (2OG) and Fe(II)-dependent oxygenase superfamily protein [Striga asiatica]
MPNSDNINLQSYPPFFRPDLDHDAVDCSQKSTKPDSDSDSDSDSIPVIDFQGMSPENLGRACREWGMFRLVNHEVPESLLGRLHETAQMVFDLGFESKQGLFKDPILYFWGSPAISLAGNYARQAVDRVNWLEGLNVPLEKVSKFKYDEPLLESFRSLLEEYGKHQTRLVEKIFGMISDDLNFPPAKSSSYMSTATGFLRVYRYFQCPTPDQNWGIGAHTDSSVLSILHQDQVGGLQVYKNHKWVNVRPVFGTLIVNLGDMLQAMSDDKYVSVTHRVKVNEHKERFSIGYFVFPVENAVIESSNYRPFTYADFQAEKESDLKTVGRKIGLPRFRKEASSSHVLE